MFKRFLVLVTFYSLGFFNLEGNACMGYSFAVKGSFLSNKVTPDFDGIYKVLNQEHKSNVMRLDVISSYVYPLPKFLVLGGQVYYGYNLKDTDLKRTGKTIVDNKEYTIKSSLILRSRHHIGFDVFLGTSVSGFLIYGSCGVELSFPQVRGVVQEGDTDTITPKFAVSFGKEPVAIDKINFPKIRQSSGIMSAFTLGAGVRYDFVKILFVGVEFKYRMPKNKELKMKNAIYDKEGVLGTITSDSISESKNRKTMKVRSKYYSLGLIVGAKI